MGRLFWKFFAFVWLAQLGGIVAVGGSFWLSDRQTEGAYNRVVAGPMADLQLNAADSVLTYAGVTAFANWSKGVRGPVVYALDLAGRDALGRPVPAELTARNSGPNPGRRPDLREVVTGDGHRYTLYAIGNDIERLPGDLPPLASLRYGPRSLPLPMPIVVTLAASVVTALLLASYVAKPIRSMKEAFEAAAAGDLERRVAPQLGARHDELADLGRDFDRMAARLKASMLGQRRLLHDVSHELRSPLARLQAAAGLIRQSPENPSIMVCRIEEEIAHIDGLVGQLLNLSRLEAGELIAVEEEVDLRELVSGVVHDANFETQPQHRQVAWEDGGAMTVTGRPDILHSAIENIVRNALKHAPDSPTIWVESSSDVVRRQFLLRVLDDGPGVPDSELPELFTPFFRGSGGARTDGHGLGLTIARRSIEAHGGTIRASNRFGGGLSVEIALPWRRAT